MYKSFIFDLDGTIIDSERIGLEALQSTLRQIGILKDIEELRFSIVIPGLRTLEILEIADIPTTLNTWLEKQKPFMKHVPVFQGMIEVIAKLPNTAIVTSQNKKELQAGFEKLNIAHHFQSVICADDTEKHKPNPEPLELALKILNCKASEAIYIGDSVYDLRCAKSAGVDFGLAYWGAKSKEGFEDANYIFTTPNELLNCKQTI
ncbi:MAG: HAD family hydrolase [Bacillota bacterium]